MLEDILDLAGRVPKTGPIHIIAGSHLEEPISQCLGRRSGVILVGEPQGRNTAPAIGLASRLISRLDPKGVMMVLTADHAIAPPSEFARAVTAAAESAARGESLVTFGILPTRPETGYGYIRAGKGLPDVRGLKRYTSGGFREKPSAPVARRWQKQGGYFWNSGMFAWRVDLLDALFHRFLPEVKENLDLLGTAQPGTQSFRTRLRKAYRGMPSESIDYGIMEKAPSVEVVVPAFSWDDMGSWEVLDRRNPPGPGGNRLLGRGVALDSRNVTAFAPEGMVALLGVRDLLVVQYEGVTLVCGKERLPELKKLVARVRDEKKLNRYL